MGRSAAGHSYVVKNTFVELRYREDGRRQRSTSDLACPVESQSLQSSPSILPTAAPAEKLQALADEPGRCVLSTPSPFLYPAPSLELPEHCGGDCGMLLPPAFENEALVAYEMMEGFDGPGMHFQGFPPFGYDANTDTFVPCGWGPMEFDGMGPAGQGFMPCLQDLGDGMEGMEGINFGEGMEGMECMEGMTEALMDGTVEAQEGIVFAEGPADGDWSLDGPSQITQDGEAPADTRLATDTASWSEAAESAGGSAEAEEAVGHCDSSSPSSRRQGRGSDTPASAWASSGTTVMLRNIPNKYTRDMLVRQLNSTLRGQFDFVYLPIDFKNRCNVGYCFINFRTLDVRDIFVESFDGVEVSKCLPGLNSKKIAEVAPARVHGRDDNVKRLRNSPVMNELVGHPDWMPLIFDEDGYEVPFPVPDQPLPAVKPRSRRRQDCEGHEGGGSSGRYSQGRKESGGRHWRRS